jgi:uncharacterized protein (DUF2267 family)
MKFQQYAQDAQKFVGEIATELGPPANIKDADRIMMSVLHTIRETLTPEESMHLISQLPMLIKAFYVHGWRINRKSRIRSMDDFIERLMLENPNTTPLDFRNDEKAIAATKAVLRVLRRHISVGEVKDIVDQLPAELTGLWLTDKEESERYTL